MGVMNRGNVPGFNNAKGDTKPQQTSKKEVVVVDETELRMKELLKKREEEKRKRRKTQISTYLEPDVYEKFKDYGGGEKGAKAELINDLLRSWFKID